MSLSQPTAAHSRDIGAPAMGWPVRLLRRMKRRWARAGDRRRPPAEVRFLVLGAGRGGTSLFASLLATHPQVAMGFEFECADSLLGEDLPPSPDPARLLDDRLDAFVDRCRHRAGRNPDRMWGNKITTEHIRALEDHNLMPANIAAAAQRDVLREFLARFAQARVLFVLRDGRACVRSKVQRTGQDLEDACERWRYSVEVLQQLSVTHGERLLVVRFEDLVTDPAATMARACAFLDLDMAVDLAAGTRSKGMRADYRRDSIDATAAAAGAVPAGVEALLENELRATGYLPPAS